MSPAERQRKRRAKLRSENKKVFYVRGEGGIFDERIRVAFAVKQLANKGLLSEDVLDLIINESTNLEDLGELNKKYIRKIVTSYLKNIED